MHIPKQIQTHTYSTHSHTFQVQTVAGQVIVKYDGYTIFSRYPFYPNLAAGGLFVWPVREQSSSVITQGKIDSTKNDQKYILIP